MKKIYKVILTALLLFIAPLVVYAIDIDSVDISVRVDNEGTAHVTEKWNNPVPNSNATEFYKTYSNLGNMKITNFKVTYNTKTFEYDSNWDIDQSFEEKAYKNGLYYENDSTELCWGITDKNSGDYILTYDIEGFVVGLNDADMIYFSFIPDGNNIDDFHLRLYSDFTYSDNLPVWSFGKYGSTAYVYDGYVEANSEGQIDDDEYITLLVKFDKGAFTTTNTEDYDFDHYKDLAMDGAVAYKEKKNSIFEILASILSVLVPMSFVMFIAIKSASTSGNKVGHYSIDYGSEGKTLPKDIPNVRDVPFNKDIYKAYFIAECYGLNKNKTDFLGAILLKWLKQGKIRINKLQSGLLKNKETSAIDLTKEETFDNPLELELYQMMKEASKDGILESNEFEKWCKNNYSTILSWFDKIIDYEADILEKEGMLISKVKTTMKVFKSTVYTLNPQMRQDAIKLKGLKNFLEEFSRIDDKEAIEVNMWEYYLIYAQILGIADKVAKQFKKLYPNLLEEQNYGYGFDDIIFINVISHSGMNSASIGKQRAENYSAGGGGFGFGGGGGGSFGGGGSMGSR